MSAVEGWQTKWFHELGTLVSGSTPPTTVSSYWDGEVVWVTPNDLSKLNTPYLMDSARKITAKGLKSCSAQLLPSRSIVISSRAPIGYVAIPSVEFCTNQGCKSIKLKDDFDPEFTYYNILSNVDRVKNLGEGTTFAEISKATLSNVQVDFPTSKLEQTRIAEVLLAVDRTIEQTEALIAKQQRIKTGLMQDLLTRGIDEHGNPRSEETHEFKDSPLGRIPVEWYVTTIGEKFERRVERGKPGLPIMSIVMNDGLVERSSVDRRVESNLSAEGHALVCEGDIAYNMMRMWQGVLGRASFDCLVSPAYVVLKPRDSVDTRFAEWLFRDKRSILKFRRYSRGIVDDRLRLYAHDMFPIEFTFPKALDEQHRIAEILDAHDTRIRAEEAYLRKLKLQKKGLMQDLLTGEKRVTPLLEDDEQAARSVM